jgi:hypothetical protein
MNMKSDEKATVTVKVDLSKVETALEKLTLLEPSLVKCIFQLIVNGLPAFRINSEDDRTGRTGDILLRVGTTKLFDKIISAFGAG